MAALAAGFEALGDGQQAAQRDAAEVAVLAGDLPGVTPGCVPRGAPRTALC